MSDGTFSHVKAHLFSMVIYETINIQINIEYNNYIFVAPALARSCDIGVP